MSPYVSVRSGKNNPSFACAKMTILPISPGMPEPSPHAAESSKTSQYPETTEAFRTGNEMSPALICIGYFTSGTYCDDNPRTVTGSSENDCANAVDSDSTRYTYKPMKIDNTPKRIFPMSSGLIKYSSVAELVIEGYCNTKTIRFNS